MSTDVYIPSARPRLLIPGPKLVIVAGSRILTLRTSRFLGERGGKDERKRAACAKRAGCPYVAAVPPRDGAGNRQADASTGNGAHFRRLTSIHAVKNQVLFIIRNANAAVRH